MTEEVIYKGQIGGAVAYGKKQSDGTLAPLLIDSSGQLITSGSGGEGGGAVTVANGADVALGSTTDAAASGSQSATAATAIALMKGTMNDLETVVSNTSTIVTNTAAIAASTATPYVGTEDSTSRSSISLLKGIKNHIYSLYGALVAGVSLTTGWSQVTVSGTAAGPSTSSGAYTINDRIGPASGSTPSSLAGMALANGRGGTITAIRITCNKKSVTPVIRVHFFNDSSATLSADNVVWKEMYADRAKRIGYYDLSAMQTAADTTNSDCSRIQDFDVRVPYLCASSSTTLYFALELIGGTLTLDASTEFTLEVKATLN